jgi:hypothetical protein
MLGFCLTVCVAASSNQEAGQSQEAEVKELDPCWSSPMLVFTQQHAAELQP